MVNTFRYSPRSPYPAMETSFVISLCESAKVPEPSSDAGEPELSLRICQFSIPLL